MIRLTFPFICKVVKTLHLLIVSLFMFASAEAQTFVIKSITRNNDDLSASIKSRIDLNEKKCGLVKVQCVLDGLSFSGNIIGNVNYQNGEYWVYMTDGSKQLSVHHPQMLPLKIDFSHSISESISAGITYCVVLSIPETLYVSLLNEKHTESQQSTQHLSTFSQPDNSVVHGVITDAKDGEPMIGCSIHIKNTRNGAISDFDGEFTLSNVRQGSTLLISYVGYKRKEITFTGKIPPNFTTSLRKGRGTEKEEFYYDPNDTSEYFDLKGNKLSQRPTQKGEYLRITDGKVEKFSIN